MAVNNKHFVFSLLLGLESRALCMLGNICHLNYIHSSIVPLDQSVRKWFCFVLLTILPCSPVSQSLFYCSKETPRPWQLKKKVFNWGLAYSPWHHQQQAWWQAGMTLDQQLKVYILVYNHEAEGHWALLGLLEPRKPYYIPPLTRPHLLILPKQLTN